MAKSRRKVVLLIVEGESDETLLIDRRDHGDRPVDPPNNFQGT